MNKLCKVFRREVVDDWWLFCEVYHEYIFLNLYLYRPKITECGVIACVGEVDNSEDKITKIFHSTGLKKETCQYLDIHKNII